MSVTPPASQIFVDVGTGITRSPPTATDDPPGDPAPSARHARALQVNILPRSSSWLHLLKARSL
ncbi:MAG: hypothetical protein V3S07_09035, partial [Micropepsaceae bacterium]